MKGNKKCQDDEDETDAAVVVGGILIARLVFRIVDIYFPGLWFNDFHRQRRGWDQFNAGVGRFFFIGCGLWQTARSGTLLSVMMSFGENGDTDNEADDECNELLRYYHTSDCDAIG